MSEIKTKSEAIDRITEIEAQQANLYSQIHDLELERTELARRTYPTSYSNVGKTYAPDAFED